MMKNKYILLLLFLLSSLIISAQSNIIPNTQDCSSTRPPFSFNIKTFWQTGNNMSISNFCTPLAGDLDGDGITEVLALNGNNNILYIFDGKTGSISGSINFNTTLVGPNFSNWATNPYVICDVDGDGKAEIFVVNTREATATLYTISSATGQRPITFKVKWTTNLPNAIKTYSKCGAIPFVADLDGDGEPEFIVANYIIETNGKLCSTTLNYGGAILGPNFTMTLPYAIDLDNDGIPEIVVGTDVYKYNGITATLWKRCPAYPNGMDGTNMAADINLDGNVDLVFHDTYNTSTGKMVVWTPSTGQIIGTIQHYGDIYRSYPVIGNINKEKAKDGKDYPEICYNGINRLVAYKYNGTSFEQLWLMKTNEGSGVATFTFFDFNMDGVAELVYRDEQNLHIYDCTTDPPTEKYRMSATSGTLIETPIVADVTGDGSANIIVTGSKRLHVFEGGASKWASCPNVWNQQLYSPLLIGKDLKVISPVKSPKWNEKDCNNTYPRHYNGGPMQVPFISEENFCPIDISSDVYIKSGNISISGSSVTITIEVGNQGLTYVPANTPIRFYKNAILPSNVLSSANTTLGVDLAVGKTHTIVKTITGLNPMPSKFFVRVMDDGSGIFPPTGGFSDCNLTNNTKSFGTLELTKVVNSLSACVDGTSIFTVKLTNNTDQTSTPTAYNYIVLTDKLGNGWDFISATPDVGTVGSYNPITKEIKWTLPTLAPGKSARLIMSAKAITAGSNRNSVWVESVNGVNIGQESIEAYVIVASQNAPDATTITPNNPKLCYGSFGVKLTAALKNASSYQWYLNDVEIIGADQQTYIATQTGTYKVSYFNGTCVSQLSAPVTVNSNCITSIPDTVMTKANTPINIDVLNNDILSGCTKANIGLSLSTKLIPKLGVAAINSKNIVYTPSKDKYGIDSLRYILKDCNSADKDSATVYIALLKATSLNYIACKNAMVTLEMLPINNVDYYWYNAQKGGSIVSGGSKVNALNIIKGSSADIHTWWVEARYKNIVFPRFRIDLLESTNCGTTNPTGCALNGTLLFKEDFGGNSPSDPIVKSNGIPQVTGYTYNSTGLGTDTYGIRKQSVNNSGEWFELSDHTYPNDITKGYLISFTGSGKAKELYNCEIDGLCSGAQLYFSVWLANLWKSNKANKPNQVFYIEDMAGNKLASYYTGNIPHGQSGWKQYGFEFTVPNGYTSIRLRILNNSTGSDGNSFVMDDVEIRLCIPAPEIKQPSKDEIAICPNSEVKMTGTYNDVNSIFGGNLVFRWEYSTTGNINNRTEWSVVPGSQKNASVPNKINESESTLQIPNMSASNEGYYRFIVANAAKIDIYNCRAMSRVVHLKVNGIKSIMPDIRVQACPNMGNLNLNKYMDMTDIISHEWSLISGPSSGFNINGTISTNVFTIGNTNIYGFSVKNTCYTMQGKLYLTVLNNNVYDLPPETVLTYYKHAETLHLNQIMGLKSKGVFITNGQASNYLEQHPSTGAYMFNGKKAYKELPSTYNYSGNLTTDPNAKKVEFIYTPSPQSCLGGQTYLLTVILIDE